MANEAAATVMGSSEPEAQERPKDEITPLVERARGGDRAAFDALFDHFVDDVHRWVTRLVSASSDREDLVQDVFVSAYRGLPRYRGQAAFRTWLYRITANVAYDHLRRRRRRDPVAWSDEVLAGLVSPELSPEAQADRRAELQRIFGLLDRLTPRKRIAFVLHIVEGKTLQEVGDIVGARAATIGQRVHFARRELRTHLDRLERNAARTRDDR